MNGWRLATPLIAPPIPVVTPAGLVPVQRRPAVLMVDRCLVRIHVHDDYYRAALKQWKRQMAAAHPDHGGSATTFRRVRSAYRSWLTTEEAWYAAHGGLPLPDWSSSLAGGIAA